jgi:hypothetical protein
VEYIYQCTNLNKARNFTVPRLENPIQKLPSGAKIRNKQTKAAVYHSKNNLQKMSPPPTARCLAVRNGINGNCIFNNIAPTQKMHNSGKPAKAEK